MYKIRCGGGGVEGEGEGEGEEGEEGKDRNEFDKIAFFWRSKKSFTRRRNQTFK